MCLQGNLSTFDNISAKYQKTELVKVVLRKRILDVSA